MAKKLTAIGAYIFAGGFSLGVRKHFDVLAHFEDGPFGTETVRKNLPKIAIHQDPATWPIKEYAGKIDYMYANPPCAPWSNAGSRTGRTPWQQNPLTACWKQTAELVWKLRPKVAHIESVRPLYTKGREMIDAIIAEGKKHGYQGIALLEDALDCNMAQKRPRFVLCLTRYDYQATPTRGKDVTPLDVLMEYYAAVTQPEANQRRALQANGGTHQKLTLKHTRPGEKLYRAYNRMLRETLKGEGAPSMIPKRLHPLKPSPTQTGQAVIFTWGNLRRAAPDLSKTIEGKVLAQTPPGGRLSRVHGVVFPNAQEVDGKVKGRPSMLKYRLSTDKPSPTQPGGAILFHHAEDRYLTIGEAAALCSYPPDFEFVGSISSAYAQMGKAVMPNVGEHLAHDAKLTIGKKKKLKSFEPLEILIKRDEVVTRPMPGAEPVPLDLPFEPDPPKVIKPNFNKKRMNGKLYRIGIGYYMRGLILKGASDDKVLLEAKKKFPDSKATIADVRWNRGHLKEGGKFYGEQH